MSAQDSGILCTDTSCCQNVLVVLNGKDLTSDQTRHTYPVQKSEYDKHGDHVRSQLFQHRSGNERF